MMMVCKLIRLYLKDSDILYSDSAYIVYLHVNGIYLKVQINFRL